MIALWIVLGVLAVLLITAALLYFLGRAEVRVVYGKNLIVTAYVLGRKFPFLFDDEEKEEMLNSGQLSPEEAEHWKNSRRKANKRKFEALDRAAEELQIAYLDELPKLTLSENLDWILAFVKILYKETNGKLRLCVKRMTVRVGAGDAAATAILFGTVSQVLAYLLHFIDTHFNKVEREDDVIKVVPDFVYGKSDADIYLNFSVPIYRAIPLALHLIDSYEDILTSSYKKALKRLNPQSNQGQDR